jgi:hypothetical protein
VASRLLRVLLCLNILFLPEAAAAAQELVVVVARVAI